MSAYYTVVVILSVLAMLIMALFVHENMTLSKEKKKQFHILFLLIIICGAAEWTGVLLQNADPATRYLHIFVKVVELSLAPILGVVSAAIVGTLKHKKVVYMLLAIHMLLECCSGFFGFIFYVDENNVYYHGEFYWIYIAAYLISIFFLVFKSQGITLHYQYSSKHILSIIIVFLLFGLAMQMINSSVRVDWICLAMTAMMLYIFYNEMIQQTDALTLLLNRRSYENHTQLLRDTAAILFFDVDNFKTVNDRYGHQTGDLCLTVIGEELKRVYAPYGYCYRIGGDEFCVIADKKIENVAQWNHSFFMQLEKRRNSYNWLPNVTVGYAIYDPMINSVEDAIKSADTMMYRYKKINKNKPDNL